jgi:hypothetical protein
MNEPTGGALTPWHSLISEDDELYGVFEVKRG